MLIYKGNYFLCHNYFFNLPFKKLNENNYFTNFTINVFLI